MASVLYEFQKPAGEFPDALGFTHFNGLSGYEFNRHTTMAQAAQLTDDLPVNVLNDVLYCMRLDATVKSYLKSVVQKRTVR